MIRFTCTLALLCGLGLSFAAAAQTQAPGTLEVGTAKVDITPTAFDQLNPMGGGFTGVHDPIYLRALVIDNGSERLAIVATDLIEVGDMSDIRQRIESELGIPFDHILITASHDHSAPRLGRVSPGALAHDGGPQVQAYTAWVYDRMISALKQSVASLQPARMGIGEGRVDVNVNRDLYTADRGWRLGYNPDGPSNKTIQVLKFVDLSGKPIAVLLNYAVHSTVTLGWNLISGDLAGAAADYVETQLGAGAVALWTLGSVGDQAPRVSPSPPRGDRRAAGGDESAAAFAAAAAQGLMVGAEALRVAQQIDARTGAAAIAAQERVVSCAVKQGEDVMDTMHQAQVPEVDLRLGLLMIGPVALAGVSGEVVTQIETRLQRASPLKHTMLVSIANDRIGYLADDAAYDRPIFEVKGSPVQRGCAEQAIVGNFVEMIAAHLGLSAAAGD